MSAKQRLRVGKRRIVDGQLDWLVEWGESTEIVDDMIWGPMQNGGDGHREHEDQQNSGVDQKAR